MSGFTIGLALPAIESARAAGRRAQASNNLKQIALALINYETTNNHFPSAYSSDKTTGKPLLSWRVAILPFIDEQGLYEKFHLDEPWNSPNNSKLIAQMPKVYRSPASQLKPGMTNYLTFRDKDSVFPGKEETRLADITDGSSNTLMAVEVDDAKSVVWTKPDDLDFNAANPLAGLGGLWNSGFVAAFCDGSVRFISRGIDPITMTNLVNRHDGNPIDADSLNGSQRPVAVPAQGLAPAMRSEGSRIKPQ